MLAFAGFWLANLWILYILDLRDKLRYALKDLNVTYDWTNNELDNALTRAVADFSDKLPRERETTFTTTSASRDVDVSSISASILQIFSVEYPDGNEPKTFVPSDLYGDTLEIKGYNVPDGSDAVVRWGSAHSLDTTQKTFKDNFDEVIVLGASGYAAIAHGEYTMRNDTAGGWDINKDHERWGNNRLLDFYRRIARFTSRRPTKAIEVHSWRG